jgi:hypothetical protein
VLIITSIVLLTLLLAPEAYVAIGLAFFLIIPAALGDGASLQDRVMRQAGWLPRPGSVARQLGRLNTLAC